MNKDPIEMQKIYLSNYDSSPFTCLSCGKQSTRQGTKNQPCIHCGTLHDIRGTFYSGYDVVVLSKEDDDIKCLFKEAYDEQ